MCDLCRLYEEREAVTQLHYEDDLIICVDCKVCLVPLFVIKRHDITPNFKEEMKIEEVWQSHFGNKYALDYTQRTIHDHFHVHAREVK